MSGPGISPSGQAVTPSHCEHDRILLGHPAVVDPWPPKRAIALSSEDHRLLLFLLGEVKAEATADQHAEGRPLLAADPIETDIASRVVGSLDLDILGLARRIVDEVTDQPTPRRGSVLGCMTDMIGSLTFYDTHSPLSASSFDGLYEILNT